MIEERATTLRARADWFETGASTEEKAAAFRRWIEYYSEHSDAAEKDFPNLNFREAGRLLWQEGGRIDRLILQLVLETPEVVVRRPAPETVTVVTRETPYTADLNDLLADYKARGMDAREAYNQLIKDRALRPDVGLKELTELYGGIIPRRMAVRVEERPFAPTHHDTVTDQRVQIAKQPNGVWYLTWEGGSVGTEPLGPLPERYQPLGAGGLPEDEQLGTHFMAPHGFHVGKNPMKDNAWGMYTIGGTPGGHEWKTWHLHTGHGEEARQRAVDEMHRRSEQREAAEREIERGGPLPSVNETVKELQAARDAAHVRPQLPYWPGGVSEYISEDRRREWKKGIREAFRKSRDARAKWGPRARKALDDMERLVRAGVWHLSQGAPEEYRGQFNWLDLPVDVDEATDAHERKVVQELRESEDRRWRADRERERRVAEEQQKAAVLPYAVDRTAKTPRAFLQLDPWSHIPIATVQLVSWRDERGQWGLRVTFEMTDEDRAKLAQYRDAPRDQFERDRAVSLGFLEQEYLDGTGRIYGAMEEGGARFEHDVLKMVSYYKEHFHWPESLVASVMFALYFDEHAEIGAADMRAEDVGVRRLIGTGGLSFLVAGYTKPFGIGAPRDALYGTYGRNGLTNLVQNALYNARTGAESWMSGSEARTAEDSVYEVLKSNGRFRQDMTVLSKSLQERIAEAQREKDRAQEEAARKEAEQAKESLGSWVAVQESVGDLPGLRAMAELPQQYRSNPGLPVAVDGETWMLLQSKMSNGIHWFGAESLAFRMEAGTNWWDQTEPSRARAAGKLPPGTTAGAMSLEPGPFVAPFADLRPAYSTEWSTLNGTVDALTILADVPMKKVKIEESPPQWFPVTLTKGALLEGVLAELAKVGEKMMAPEGVLGSSDGYRFMLVGMANRPPIDCVIDPRAAVGGGPVWPASARAVLLPSYVSHYPKDAPNLEMLPTALGIAAQGIREAHSMGVIPRDTLKQWATVGKSPWKKGVVALDGNPTLKIPVPDDAVTFEMRDGEPSVVTRWRAQTGPREKYPNTRMPVTIHRGIPWEAVGERTFNPVDLLCVDQRYLREMALMLLRTSGKVFVYCNQALSPLVFVQVEGGRLQQLHILMPMRWEHSAGRDELVGAMDFRSGGNGAVVPKPPEKPLRVAQPRGVGLTSKQLAFVRSLYETREKWGSVFERILQAGVTGQDTEDLVGRGAVPDANRKTFADLYDVILPANTPERQQILAEGAPFNAGSKLIAAMARAEQDREIEHQRLERHQQIATEDPVVERVTAMLLARGLPERGARGSARHIAKIIVSDGAAVSGETLGILDPDNTNARAVFTEITGVALPAGRTATHSIVRAWKGLGEQTSVPPVAVKQELLDIPDEPMRDIATALVRDLPTWVTSHGMRPPVWQGWAPAGRGVELNWSGGWKVTLQRTAGELIAVGEVTGKQRVVAPKIALASAEHYADPAEAIFPSDWMFQIERRASGLQGVGK